MSRLTITGSTRDPKVDWNELDIDELVDRLTPGEIQSFLDECDPDDPHIPPSMRCNYKCEKGATGPLDKQKLLDFINDQALNTPDIPDRVPFVAGRSQVILLHSTSDYIIYSYTGFEFGITKIMKLEKCKIKPIFRRLAALAPFINL